MKNLGLLNAHWLKANEKGTMGYLCMWLGMHLVDLAITLKRSLLTFSINLQSCNWCQRNCRIRIYYFEPPKVFRIVSSSPIRKGKSCDILEICDQAYFAVITASLLWRGCCVCRKRGITGTTAICRFLSQMTRSRLHKCRIDPMPMNGTTRGPI